ncbi:TPA: LexA family protein [Serratia marcescens]
MSTIGQRIRQRRKEKKLTQKAVANFVGASPSAVTQWELDTTQPKGENLLKLASLLECSPNWLISGKNKDAPAVPSTTGELASPNISRIPIISWVQAGSWTATDCITEPEKSAEWIEIPISLPAGSFALKVKGESMTAPSGMSIPDGAIVVVEPDIFDIESAIGKIVIAQQDGSGEATIKRLVQDGGDYYLLPLNPAFKTLHADDSCRIVGIVRQIIINF